MGFFDLAWVGLSRAEAKTTGLSISGVSRAFSFDVFMASGEFVGSWRAMAYGS
jgi:hypothetical protein